MKKYKLGLKASHDRPRLWFGDYFNAAELPKPPDNFSNLGVVKRPWMMLANDSLGDCVIAGGMHMAMLWGTMGGALTPRFTDADAIDDYSAITGYVPGKPATDQGTDMVAAAKYWQATGMRDATGARHKIDAFVSLQPGNLDELKLGMWLFGAVGLGILVGEKQEQQFEARQPWNFDVTDKPDGGHFVPAMAWNPDGTIGFVTWGGIASLTQKFFLRRCDQLVGYLSLEMLDAKGLSPQQFNRAQLEADLALLAKS